MNQSLSYLEHVERALLLRLCAAREPVQVEGDGAQEVVLAEVVSVPNLFDRFIHMNRATKMVTQPLYRYTYIAIPISIYRSIQYTYRYTLIYRY